MTMTERVRSEFPDASDEFCASYGRTIRNDALAVSDWAMTSDAPTNKQAWADYRQALRDLPNDANWPNVEIPTAPA